MVSSVLSINQSIIIQHAGHNAGYNYNKYLFASKTFCLDMGSVKLQHQGEGSRQILFEAKK